jgi:TolA-binding protein
MKKLLLLISSLPLLASEPSAFGAGDLESKKPYGLTTAEKVILSNKKDIKSLRKKLSGVKLQLEELIDKNEGIKSVLESVNSKIGKQSLEISAIKTNFKALKEQSIQRDEDIQKEISQLKNYLDENKKIQEDNYKKIKEVLSELGSIIDTINNTYLTKEEFAKEKEDILKEYEKFNASLLKKIEEIEKKIQSKKIKSIDSSQLLKQAVDDFRKDKYKDAALKFEKLVKRNFKPARCNYYLGEIAYYQDNFAKAIEYYKKSISLYDKASYIPTLLLHTGISFDKLGKKSEAYKFYDAVMKGYPSSKEAKMAKKRRKNANN